MARTDDSAALAANWRTILLFDAVMGVVVAVVGLVLIAAVTVPVGVVVAALGAGYTALVGARARRWRQLRRAASAK